MTTSAKPSIWNYIAFAAAAIMVLYMIMPSDGVSTCEQTHSRDVCVASLL